MKRIYLSGLVASIGVKVAHSRFAYAEECLEAAERRWRRRLGMPEGRDWQIVNPMRGNPRREGRWRIKHILSGLRLLLECDAVMMLPEWEERSLGAQLERCVALLLQKEVFYFHPEDKLHFSKFDDSIIRSILPPFCYHLP